MKWSLIIIPLLFLPGPVAAQPPSSEDFEYFREEYLGVKSFENEQSMGNMLFALLKEGKNPETAVSNFAETLGVSLDTAENYARLLIEAMKIDEACNNAPLPATCDGTKYDGFAERLQVFGHKNRDGSLLTEIGKMLHRKQSRTLLLSSIRGHPSSARILLELYDYGVGYEFIELAIETSGRKPLFLARLLAQLHDGLGAPTDLALADLLLEALAEKPEFRRERLIVESWHLSDLLFAGLNEQAVTNYAEMPEDEKAEMWRLLAHPGESHRGNKLRTNRYAFWLAPNLAAAFIHSGRTEEALKVIAFARNELDRILMSSETQQLALLEEIITPRLGPPEVYDLFINGYKKGDPEPTPGLADDTRTPPHFGWLWAASSGSAALKLLGSQYLDRAGFPEMAGYLMQDFERHFSSYRQGPKIMATLATLIGSALGEKQREYAAAYESAREEFNSAAAKRETATQATPIRVAARPAYFEEKPLPAEYLGKTTEAEETEPDFPKHFTLPVDSYQIARLEKVGEEFVLVYTSHALDPAGEISKGGYWITKTTGGGRKWEPPLYLGLQQYHPYVVAEHSALPLLEDGTVNLEVRIRELDEASITLPPVGLRAKRRKDGIYLKFKWKALRRDKDGDGLSDLVEHRMGLDPSNTDSDGDGLLDGVDGLPLTPFDPHASKDDTDMAFAIIKHLFGYERLAIITGIPGGEESKEKRFKQTLRVERPMIDPQHTVFLEGDPGLFAGLNTSRRLLILGSAEMRTLRKAYGVFFPLSIKWIFVKPDRSQAYVIWSAGWTGGKFNLIKTEDGYEVEDLSRWVT